MILNGNKSPTLRGATQYAGSFHFRVVNALLGVLQNLQLTRMSLSWNYTSTLLHLCRDLELAVILRALVLRPTIKDGLGITFSLESLRS